MSRECFPSANRKKPYWHLLFFTNQDLHKLFMELFHARTCVLKIRRWKHRVGSTPPALQIAILGIFLALCP